MAGLTQRNGGPMRKAKSFSHIRTSVVYVLARLAARNAVKEQLRDQGVRVTLVPIRQVHEQADEYLRQHPELYAEARERALREGMIDLQPPMVTPDDPRSERNS